MTEATFKSVIKQVEAKLGADASQQQMREYLQAVEEQKKVPGLVKYFDGQNGSLDLDIDVTPVAKKSNAQVPAHIQERLAEIASRFKLEIAEVEKQYVSNFNDPVLTEGLDGEDREREAWTSIVLDASHAVTMGARKGAYTFVLFQVDSEPGSYDKWVKKPGARSEKEQIQVPTGIAGGFGLFIKDGDNDEAISEVNWIGAFDNKGAKSLTELKPFTVYTAELEKTKRGFTIPDVFEYEVVEIKSQKELIDTMKPLVAKLAKDAAYWEKAKIGKKSKQVVIEARILDARSDIHEETGRQSASLKLTTANPELEGEPPVIWARFWGDGAKDAFSYGARSHVLIGASAKHDEEFGNQFNGRWIMPIRAYERTTRPTMPPYQEP